MSEALTQHLSWRGRTVAWDRLGSGPPVVMCHGTPWSAQLWAPFAAALSHRYTVYLWDMPGYGQSSKDPAHAVDLGVQGELLADLVTTWGLRAPHVVAHDYGGAVALRAHLLHAARYASLALVDVVALRPWGSAYFRLVKDHPEVFGALPAAVHRGALEAYLAGASRRGLTAETMDALTAPWLGEEGQAAFYRQIAQADERYTAEIEERYTGLDMPVRILWGRHDTWVPVDRAARLAALIPGATVEVVEDAGHLIQLDAPVALATALTRWLTEVAAG